MAGDQPYVWSVPSPSPASAAMEKIISHYLCYFFRLPQDLLAISIHLFKCIVCFYVGTLLLFMSSSRSRYSYLFYFVPFSFPQRVVCPLHYFSVLNLQLSLVHVVGMLVSNGSQCMPGIFSTGYIQWYCGDTVKACNTRTPSNYWSFSRSQVFWHSDRELIISEFKSASHATCSKWAPSTHELEHLIIVNHSRCSNFVWFFRNAL
jgi:hypothetical protein